MRIKAIFVSLVIALSSAAVLAQSTSYAVPRNVALERITRRTFPQYFGRANRYPVLIPEEFFPVGWSKDGKFAYYYEPVDEACGCYFANLVIQDLITDKVLWEFKYSQDDTMDDQGRPIGPANIRQLWRKNRKLFSEKLAEHGIIASSFAAPTKTFASGGDSFTARAAVKMGPNDGLEDRVNLYTVTLTSPRLGTKTVFTSEDHTKDEYWFNLNTAVIGVLKSPYEKRVAVIVMEVRRGYEGPPHTGDIRILGSDLKSGFSRK